MIRVILIVVLMAPFIGSAQEPVSAPDTLRQVDASRVSAPITRVSLSEIKIRAQFVKLEGSAHFGSNGIDNSFTNKLIWGGHIDSLFIDPVLNKLDDKGNFLAGEIDFNIQVFKEANKLFKRDNLGWYVRAGYTQLMRIEFTKDVFGLAFKGNAQYEGAAADLSLRFQREHYQKIEFGLGMDGASQTLGLGLYFGNSFSNIVLNNSRLYTHDGAYQIDLALKAKADFSDSSSAGVFSGAGYGAGLNYSWDLRDPVTLKSYFKLSLEDFGVMFWNKKSRGINKDTIYNYSGFEISDLLNNQVNFDNLEDTLGLTAESSKLVTVLPFYLRFAKIANYKGDKTFSPIFGINYRYIYHRIPEVYFGACYFPARTTLIKASVAYGGYYGLHCNFGLGMVVSNKISIGVETMAFFNTLSPTGLGKSAQFRLVWIY